MGGQQGERPSVAVTGAGDVAKLAWVLNVQRLFNKKYLDGLREDCSS